MPVWAHALIMIAGLFPIRWGIRSWRRSDLPGVSLDVQRGMVTWALILWVAALFMLTHPWLLPYLQSLPDAKPL